MLVFSQIVPKDFIHEFLPDYIMGEFMNSMDIGRFASLDEYFDSLGISLSTTEIIEYALRNLEVKEVNGAYIIDFSDTLTVDGYSVRQLINIIDYGNTEVRGTRAIGDIEEFIRGHRAMLLSMFSPEG